MDWEIHEDSLRIDRDTIEVVLQGRDGKSGDYWEIRVAAAAMEDRCGAEGQENPELRRAFKEYREKILNVAYQKHRAGQSRRLNDRILIPLDKEDFDTFREKPVS